MGRRALAARGIPWLAPVALVIWYVLTYREGAVVGVPWLALWAAMLLAGGAGLLVLTRVPQSVGRPVTAAVLAASTALALLTFGVVHYLVPATALQATVAAVLIAASLLAGAVTGLRSRWGLSAGSVVAAQAIAMWIVVDVAWIQTDVHIGERIQIFLLYDFKVYLAAGRNFLAGETVYLDHVMTALPATTHDDFFLYPPVLLPVMAAIASVPRELAEPAFFVALLAAGAVAFRLIGLSWPWALLLVAYPPVFKGAISGNVANFTFALYAAAPFVGALLVLGLLFKVHAAIPALWLVRTRRWRDLAIGIGLLLLLGLVTLPLVGVQSWIDYFVGLTYREQTQQALPVLYGHSLAQYLPLPLFAALSLAAVAVALVAGGRKSLAMLGLAMIVASPSLWPHGFMMALPAALALPTPVLWLTLGVALTGGALWLLPAVAVTTIVLDWQRLRIGPDPVHPLGGTAGPWGRAQNGR
jgi:hypothetical protein